MGNCIIGGGSKAPHPSDEFNLLHKIIGKWARYTHGSTLSALSLPIYVHVDISDVSVESTTHTDTYQVSGKVVIPATDSNGKSKNVEGSMDEILRYAAHKHIIAGMEYQKDGTVVIRR